MVVLLPVTSGLSVGLMEIGRQRRSGIEGGESRRIIEHGRRRAYLSCKTLETVLEDRASAANYLVATLLQPEEKRKKGKKIENRKDLPWPPEADAKHANACLQY